MAAIYKGKTITKTPKGFVILGKAFKSLEAATNFIDKVVDVK